ncbi:MAG: cytochrome b [Coxiellaceae bacterium]|nr:cytochrome b [Coxiellaceae bacterium]
MTIRNDSESYGTITKLLHWVIFLCVLAQILIGFFREDIANKTIQGDLMMIHKSIGLSLIVLSILFILWGIFSRKPDWPVDMGEWEKIAARIGHTLLYCLVLVMALSGLCMSTAAGYPSSWFGVFTVLAPWVPISKPLASTFAKIHVLCAWALVVVGCIHIAASLKHQYMDKDHILSRMMPG